MNKSSQEIATVKTEANRGKEKKKKIIGTRQITYRAILVALALVCKLMGQMFSFGDFKITFVYLPWIIAGIAMGPLGGAAVAFITDLIGTLIISTGGLPLPLTILSNTLIGFIFGLAFKIPKIDPRLKLLIGTAVALFACTLGIGTYQLALISNTSFKSLFILRISTQAPVFLLNAVIVGFLFPVLKKIDLM